MPGKRGGASAGRTFVGEDKGGLRRIKAIKPKKKEPSLLGKIKNAVNVVSDTVDSNVESAVKATWNAQARPVKAVAGALGVPQMVSDTWWTAKHPVDRIMGRGRAKDPIMMVASGKGPRSIATEALYNSWHRTLPSGRAQTRWNRDALSEARTLKRLAKTANAEDLDTYWAQSGQADNPEFAAILQDPRFQRMLHTTGSRLERGAKSSMSRGRRFLKPWEMSPDEFLASPDVSLHWTLAGPKSAQNRLGLHAGTAEAAVDRSLHVLPKKVVPFRGRDVLSEDAHAGFIHGVTVDGSLAPPGYVMSDGTINRLQDWIEFDNTRNNPAARRGFHSGLAERPRRLAPQEQWRNIGYDEAKPMIGYRTGMVEEMNAQRAAEQAGWGGGDAQLFDPNPGMRPYTSARYLNNVEDRGSISVGTIDPLAGRTQRDWVLDAVVAGLPIKDEVLRAVGLRTPGEAQRAAMRRSLLRRGRLEKPQGHKARGRARRFAR